MYSPFFSPLLRGARELFFFVALTGSLGGLQGVFSVQMAMGSPYLMSLGFSKPLMPFVWIAGPLAGFIGQPYFGLCSDQCRIPWGRRKAFIAGGTLVMICSLLGLAWAGDIVYAVSYLVGSKQDHEILQTITMIAAAIFVWVLNFAIQPLQCGLRALIVECCPPDQIDRANAWASRMISIGSVFGYGFGFFDVSHLMHTDSGHTQFKALCVLATCGLAITVCLCCFTIRERDPSENGPPSKELKGIIGKVKHIYGSIFRIPPQVMMVCKVQLCSWIGWFSFMYYITTYIGEIYLQNIQPKDVEEAQKSANQYGSLALLMFAFVQLFTSVIAPYVITKPQWNPPHQTVAKTALSRLISRNLRTTWSSLCALWMLSHAIFAACMFSTFFVSNVVGAIILVSFVGISAALMQIVPFTLISLVLSQHQANSHASTDLVAEKFMRYETQPGIVMGIHNMSIAAPQLIAAVGSSAIFWLLGTDGGDKSRSTGWVLRAGGIAALAAIWMTLKVRDGADDENGDILAAHSGGAEQSYMLLADTNSELVLGRDL